METVHCGYTPDETTYPAYAQTEYAQTEYAGHNYNSPSPQSEDPNNNPYTDYGEYDDVVTQMSDLKVSGSKRNKSNRTSSKLNNSTKKDDRSRKDSFVYDVRLPHDEQFLFFVPDLDLVKSHLMFAVREEVEVLKEKILELMEQINSLEYENQVLRQYAPQEALQSLPPKKREGGGGSQPQS